MRPLLALLGMILISGAAAAQTLVDDIVSGPFAVSSYPNRFRDCGSRAMFGATSGNGDSGIWITDGTTASTRLLTDGLTRGRYTTLNWAAELAGTWYFLISEDRHDTLEFDSILCATDGTPGGTTAILRFPGMGITGLPRPVAFNGELYFVAHTEAEGDELWRTDGTAAGTFMVADVNPGPASSISYTLPLASTSNAVYFFADDGVSGRELWRTDGTAAGTAKVAEIGAGDLDGIPAGTAMIAHGGEVYFHADDGAGHAVWKSDGTSGGTVKLSPSFVGHPTELASLGGSVYFAGDAVAGPGRALWSSDGTTAGTVEIESFSYLSGPVTCNGSLFFAAQPLAANNQIHLWRSNGTPGGAALVSTLGSSGSSSPIHLTVAGTSLFFFNNSGGMRLWRSDGTAGGTVAVSPAGTSVSEWSIAPLGNGAVFLCEDPATGGEPWFSDGTPGGTAILANIAADVDGVDIGVPAVLGEDLVFGLATTFTWGQPAVWRSDGTAAGTAQKWMPSTRSLSSGPSRTIVAGGRIFQEQFNGSNGSLWVADVAGTVLEPLTSLNASILQADLVGQFGDQVFFNAFSTAGTWALWCTDGTAAGTRLIHDFDPTSPAGGVTAGVEHNGLYFVDYGGLAFTDGTSGGTTSLGPGANPVFRWGTASIGASLFFIAWDLTNGNSLWRTDGTANGTILLKSHLDTTGQLIGGNNLGALGSYVYFRTRTASGFELWRTDGTVAGTSLFMLLGDERPLDMSFATAGARLYFAASSPANGVELWATDGSLTGTSMVLDIDPGPFSSNPVNLTAWQNSVYFSAYQPGTGRELWSSDGTAAGTQLVGDIFPGALGSNPHSITPAGQRLFFVAYNDLYGREIHVLGQVGTPNPNPNPGPGPSMPPRATNSGCAPGDNPLPWLSAVLVVAAVACRRRNRLVRR